MSILSYTGIAFVIKEVGTNRVLSMEKSSFNRSSLFISELSPINRCIPRMYPTKRGATFAMNYWLGKVNDRFTYEYKSFIEHNNEDLISFGFDPDTSKFEERCDKYNLKVVPITYYINEFEPLYHTDEQGNVIL